DYVTCRGATGWGSYTGYRAYNSRGSGGIPWRTALLTGALFGSTRYMSRRRYIDNPDREPVICVNYDNQINATAGVIVNATTNATTNATYVMGRFICPMWNQNENMQCCCGPTNKEYCCECTMSIGAIVGIATGGALGLIILVSIAIRSFCYSDLQKGRCRKKKTGCAKDDVVGVAKTFPDGYQTTYGNTPAIGDKQAKDDLNKQPWPGPEEGYWKLD
ncbi:unnamed protein product, partial [Owenia fusiformis]